MPYTLRKYLAWFNLVLPSQENQVETNTTLDKVTPYQKSSFSANWICRE